MGDTLGSRFKIKESTRKRCKVVALDGRSRGRYAVISLELFHFLHEAKAIDFSLHVLVGDEAIEYIRPDELDKQLIDEVWEAAQRPEDGIEICVLKSELARFQALISRIRDGKLNALRRRFPSLDSKVLDLYGNLSNASQMIVFGGIDAAVAAQVKASAAQLVTNVIGSEAAITTLSRMIMCDPTLYDHSATVAMIATVISQRILPEPLDHRMATILSEGALYHDVGKTCVPNHILNKPGKFTPEEFEVMKEHSFLGYGELQRMINDGAEIDNLVARVALEHHEKWDGKGYPFGRKGSFEADPEQGIHFLTRIVTIADIYSALLMKRVYKPAFAPQDAIKIMAAESRGFDPDIFLPFLKTVVKSLNAEQTKSKEGGARILSMNERGDLEEWEHSAKRRSA